MIPLFKALRPKQWTKNFFLFAGIVFSLKFFDLSLLIKVIEAFIVFCGLSSSIYLLNDVRDIESDRQHPLKKNRPIAAGNVSVPVAIFIALILAAFSLIGAFLLDFPFALTSAIYFAYMLIYTFVIKDIVILDVFSIAAGFVLRAIAGVVVISVELSPWLLICTILLSLFIALGKRRNELVTSMSAAGSRKILSEYNPQLLDQMISAVAGSTVMAYALYTLWPETIAKFGTHNLAYSIPFVLYGIFRYLYLIYQKEEGGKPEDLLLTDLPLLTNIFLWLFSLIIIIYFFR